VATKLDKEVTREANFTFMGSPVLVTLMPKTETLPDRLCFRLKGRSKGVREMNLNELFARSARVD